MSVLCKFGIHRWEQVGVAPTGLAVTSVCQRCGTGVTVLFPSGESIRFTPEQVRAALTTKEDGR